MRDQRDDLRARASRAPVAKIAPGAGQRLAVTRRLRFAEAPPRLVQRRLDQLQPAAGDMGSELRNRPDRQLLDKNGFVYKMLCSCRKIWVFAPHFHGVSSRNSSRFARRFPQRNVLKRVLKQSGSHGALAFFQGKGARPAGLRYQPEFVSQPAEKRADRPHLSCRAAIPVWRLSGQAKGSRRSVSATITGLRRLQEADPDPGLACTDHRLG